MRDKTISLYFPKTSLFKCKVLTLSSFFTLLKRRETLDLIVLTDNLLSVGVTEIDDESRFGVSLLTSSWVKF